MRLSDQEDRSKANDDQNGLEAAVRGKEFRGLIFRNSRCERGSGRRG